MKKLQKSDLKEGEIYWFIGSTIKFLNKISTTNINRYSNYLYNNTYCNMEGTNLQNAVSILETTPEEKHWLETCIKADKFVSYKEAMKTFIPEFVLPEKWAIVITDENKDIVNEYRKSIFNNSNISCNLNVDNVHLSDRYDGTYYHYNKYHFKEHTNCEEITFDQFKQYVLKDE